MDRIKNKWEIKLNKTVSFLYVARCWRRSLCDNKDRENYLKEEEEEKNDKIEHKI